MKKIGITGSLASGKTTASKILSNGKGPLFSADEVVRDLYSQNIFKKKISSIFNIPTHSNFKRELYNKILINNSNIRKLEKIIHPLVRKKMNEFIKKNKDEKFAFFEIPLLIESKLMKKFNLIIFIKAKKNTRLKRFKSKGGNPKLFFILNNKQLSDKKKAKHCDYVVVNDQNKKVLKRKLLAIFKNNE